MTTPPQTDRPGDVRVTGTAEPLGSALTVIGRVRSSHAGSALPKNPTEARATGSRAVLEISEPFRPGLVGLGGYSHLYVLAWLDEARRDLVQITRPSAQAPKGVFALRSPVRPNPISLSVARILSVDVAAGRVEIDAIDLRDGTPLLDIKPYRPGIDAVPEAVVP